ncbi:MAG: DUF2917 domain-containing protein [Rubrivivax sp.]|nr:DUF2917 domain-containing protein [Rubrivivax sp.]
MSARAAGVPSGHAAPPPPGGSGCVALDHGRFLRLRGAAGTTVTGVTGLLWVTRDGSWDDVLLLPDQRFRVPDDVPVLVSAFGPSVAQVVVPPRRATGWRRLAGLLRGRARPPLAAAT